MSSQYLEENDVRSSVKVFANIQLCLKTDQCRSSLFGFAACDTEVKTEEKAMKFHLIGCGKSMCLGKPLTCDG
ncbi:hypothetical protein HGM15179_002948 [Zosterops borbonicus]|uniref:Uncharacterized protein n=1 Tax=Zosterops borbonicus TaxID=364589 RepID=A0A8K1GU74_9PASS|nr:hypothetical protein HGM15179_002948 [Zosterops borbonicus]